MTDWVDLLFTKEAFDGLVRFGEMVYNAGHTVRGFINQCIRKPNESPLEYVKRIGPASGHTIYPDEEWRYKSKISLSDWWGSSMKDKNADRNYHGE